MRATKYIVNDVSMDYKSRLTKLRMLPLMYRLELYDIMFFASALKKPDDHFNINNYFSFCSSNSQSQSFFKLKHYPVNNSLLRHSYFNRLPCLWNSLSPIDPKSSLSYIKSSVISHFTSNFISHFDSSHLCTYHYKCPCNYRQLSPSSSTF